LGVGQLEMAILENEQLEEIVGVLENPSIFLLMQIA
jgi:hypothetical protein